jgi:hypothetical protein
MCSRMRVRARRMDSDGRRECRVAARALFCPVAALAADLVRRRVEPLFSIIAISSPRCGDCILGHLFSFGQQTLEVGLLPLLEWMSRSGCTTGSCGTRRAMRGGFGARGSGTAAVSMCHRASAAHISRLRCMRCSGRCCCVGRRGAQVRDGTATRQGILFRWRVLWTLVCGCWCCCC